jgi:hypothetical protein
MGLGCKVLEGLLEAFMISHIHVQAFGDEDQSFMLFYVISDCQI